jgi:hypothetical protein
VNSRKEKKSATSVFTQRDVGVEGVYAWWCMFAETARPDSVICQEWTREHRIRQPKQYIEGHEENSFSLITKKQI